jgi:hypothetical protein
MNFIELIKQEYETFVDTPSDINQHLPILRQLGMECSHITEMGTRFGASTRAFLYTDAELRAYDLALDQNVMDLFVKAQEAGKDAQYIQADVLKIKIRETDMLFIDTWHSQAQLRQELKLHGSKVKKYLAFHDTHTYGVRDEQVDWNVNPNRKAMPNQGLLPAIIDYIIENPEWKFKYHFSECNGLTVLERTG